MKSITLEALKEIRAMVLAHVMSQGEQLRQSVTFELSRFEAELLAACALEEANGPEPSRALMVERLVKLLGALLVTLQGEGGGLPTEILERFPTLMAQTAALRGSERTEKILESRGF